MLTSHLIEILPCDVFATRFSTVSCKTKKLLSDDNILFFFYLYIIRNINFDTEDLTATKYTSR